MDVRVFLTDNITKKPRDLLMTFDTGAYMTSVDSFTLIRAGYDIAAGKSTSVDTVGHSGVPAKEIVLRGLEFEDISGARVQLGPVLVHAIDMSKTYTVGVLGLNVIREFKTRIEFGMPTIIELVPTFDLGVIEKFETYQPDCSRFGLWSSRHIEFRSET